MNTSHVSLRPANYLIRKNCCGGTFDGSFSDAPLGEARSPSPMSNGDRVLRIAPSQQSVSLPIFHLQFQSEQSSPSHGRIAISRIWRQTLPMTEYDKRSNDRGCQWLFWIVLFGAVLTMGLWVSLAR